MSGKILAHRSKLLLLLIAALTAFLTCYKMADAGYGNAYYTAAVKSMLTSRHDFFFASFDSGFVSVDKPPLGLWLQCLFAWIFGLHGWSVILPQALCSVGSVCILYRIVKKLHGEFCGLLAAFFLAVTPIFIAVSRTNNLDPSLLLVCLLAALALLSAAEKGSIGLLCLSAALVGLGFNIKMLQAFMYLPPFYFVYLFAPEAKLRYSRRALHLAAATIILLAVSLSWCLAVDLTPAENRPYVGGSTTNSTVELAVGYNGILRALPIQSQALYDISGVISMVPDEGGSAGLLRFLNREMYGQISWLLPLSVLGLIALVNKLLHTDGPEKIRVLRQLLLWGCLFVPMFAFFSLSTHLHRYYLIMLAPCLAALAAVAVFELRHWAAAEDTVNNSGRRNLLPAGLAMTAVLQLVMLRIYYFQSVRPLVYIALAAGALAALLYLAYRTVKRERKVLAAIAAAVMIAGLSAAPLYWSYTPIQYGVSAIMPSAGPKQAAFQTGGGSSEGFVNPWGDNWFGGGGFGLIPQGMLDYILAHDKGARYLISVPSAMAAANIILSSDAPVMTRGGFTGLDQIISLAQFKELVERGDVQYYYVFSFTNNDIAQYVRLRARKVDPAEYSGSPPRSGALYDLSGLWKD